VELGAGPEREVGARSVARLAKEEFEMSGIAKRCLVGAARAVLVLAAVVATTGTAWAAGGPPATKLINVVDTRGLSGMGLLVSQVYNQSFAQFGLLVVVVMVAQGVVLGFGMDKAMNLLGLDLGKLSHHE
jgi:hypothetical protein